MGTKTAAAVEEAAEKKKADGNTAMAAKKYDQVNIDHLPRYKYHMHVTYSIQFSFISYLNLLYVYRLF